MSSFTIFIMASATLFERATSAVVHHLVHRRRDDLPSHTEPVVQPPARLRLPAALEKRVPVAVELRLIVAESQTIDMASLKS